MIIVSVTGPTMAEAFSQMRASRRWADIFELRLDLIRDLQLAPLMRPVARPRVATLRPVREGGSYVGDEVSRLAVLKDAALSGVEYVDIELSSGKRAVEDLRAVSRSVRIIVSHHTNEVPRSGREAYAKFRHCGGDILKWVYPAEDSADLRFARDFLRLAHTERRKAIALAMGEAGEASRVLYRCFGGWATYAAAEEGPAAAPGQVRASMLRDTYRAPALNARTRVFGLLGNPVAQSKGIYLHNVLFRSGGANAVYVRFLTRNLAGFARSILPLVQGCSVTTPFKEQVPALARSVEPAVRRSGAANTLYRVGRALHAANSDAAGALDAIEQVCRVKGKRLLLLGAGGAARAIASEATRRGAEVIVTNRTAARAEALARDLGARAVSDVTGVEYDILANATSVGMFPHVDDMPVHAGILRPGTVVFDAIYNPRETRLLREAKAAGARVVSGAEMYVRQAARQQELFLRRRVNAGLLRRTVNRYL